MSLVLQGLDKSKNSGRVDLLLILDNVAEDLGTRGVVPEVFLGSFLKLKCDGHNHRLSAPNKIVTVKIVHRETIYFSVPSPPYNYGG